MNSLKDYDMVKAHYTIQMGQFFMANFCLEKPPDPETLIYQMETKSSVIFIK